MENRMTEQEGETPKEDQQPQGHEGDDGKGGKDQILADLARERDRRQALQKQLDDLTAAQQKQQADLAKAFGLAEGEKPKDDELSEAVRNLQEQFTATQRKSELLEVADEYGVPKEFRHLLTATEPEALKAQAESVAELVKLKQASDGGGVGAQVPGEGRAPGKQPSLSDQISVAEREGKRDVALRLKAQQLAELHGNTK